MAVNIQKGRWNVSTSIDFFPKYFFFIGSWCECWYRPILTALLQGIVDKDRILWIVLFTYKQCIRLFTYPASKQLKVSNRHNNKSCLILYFLNLFLDFCFILGFAKNMYQKDRDEVIVLHVTDHRNSSSFGCKLL